MKPPNAPISIIPSSPRFNTPERSAMVSPSAAKMTGVLKRTPDTTKPIKKSASTSFRSTLPFCNLAVG
jgi:hypothetical protein